MSDKDQGKGGYSEEGLFGEIIHYDDKGHKTGESWPGLFGDYTDYDENGHKVGTSWEHAIGGGYTHYDNQGHKTGSSEEGFFGGYTHYNAEGHVYGQSDRSVLDVKSEEEIRKTGSLYGSSYYYPHKDPGEAASADFGKGPNAGKLSEGSGSEKAKKDARYRLWRFFWSPWLWLGFLALMVIIFTIRTCLHV